MITPEEAKRRQDELQAEGWELLEYLKIIPKLEQLGEVTVEGSFACGLMVKPDIDIEVIVDPLRVGPIAELGKNLVSKEKLKLFRL